MAKKHLLYIHDIRFEKEPKKSELVNRLLAEHYAPENLQPLVDETYRQMDIIKTKEDAEKAVKPLIDNGWAGPLFRDKKGKKL